MRLECNDDPQTVLLAGILRAPRATTGDSVCRTPLTHRERNVAEYLASGTSVRDVARTLAISYHTVRRHTESIYRKTGARNRLQLAAMFATRCDDGGA
ncbi:MAG: helix-turn-helix transcriptional regulator [Gemmatimonadaceae bacterium]|nr:helix-turn-helix transcriptional regulator [Gemmatimonadaceae bacterium]